MMKYIERRLFPEGKPINSTMALTGKDYRLAGEIMAMSVIQGWPGPTFYLCSDLQISVWRSVC